MSHSKKVNGAVHKIGLDPMPINRQEVFSNKDAYIGMYRFLQNRYIDQLKKCNKETSELLFWMMVDFSIYAEKQGVDKSVLTKSYGK